MTLLVPTPLKTCVNINNKIAQPWSVYDAYRIDSFFAYFADSGEHWEPVNVTDGINSQAQQYMRKYLGSLPIAMELEDVNATARVVERWYDMYAKEALVYWLPPGLDQDPKAQYILKHVLPKKSYVTLRVVDDNKLFCNLDLLVLPTSNLNTPPFASAAAQLNLFLDVAFNNAYEQS